MTGSIMSEKEYIELTRYLAAQAFAKYDHQSITSFKYLWMGIACMETLVGEGWATLDEIRQFLTYLHVRYQQTSKLEDLDDVIRHANALLAVLPERSPDRADTLDDLGTYLRSRYERTGNLDDLDASIRQSQAVLETTPKDHPNRSVFLSNLGTRLSRRYQRTRDLDNLDAAVTHLQKAMELAPIDHPDRAAILQNLGQHLGICYEASGNLNHLVEALKYLQAAIDATPTNHPKRGGRLNNLAYCLKKSYLNTGNLDSLEAAIGYSEEALKVTPTSSPEWACRLDNLGSHLLSRYERAGNKSDLDSAIRHSYAAIEAIPKRHPTRAGRLNNLGNRLNRRYQLTGDMEDSKEAIEHFKAALEATPQDHPDRASILNNLGDHLRSRYEKTKARSIDDLKEAIRYTRAAIKATAESHPDRAFRLNYLGKGLSLYAEAVQEREPILAGEVFQESLIACRDSWACRNGSPLTRVRSAFNASVLLVSNPWVRDLTEAYSLLHDACHMMPLITSRSLGRDDQQHILSQLSGMASLAVAVALEVGRSPTEALRLLELDRNITNGQLLDYRSDISDVAEKHPSLAARFQSQCMALDSPPSSTGQFSGKSTSELKLQQLTIRNREHVARQLDATLAEIRQQQGFENFLLPPTEEYLLSAARQGPIVVLNVTMLRSDAILLTQEKITSISLPGLSDKLVQSHLGSTSDKEAMLGGGNEKMRKMLIWLWRAAVNPVLQALGIYKGKDIESSALPQIWWIGTGLLGKAPIHAAGNFIRFKGHLQLHQSTLQFCIPSYTSSIKALMYSRSRHDKSKVSTPERNILIITMRTTPGSPELYFTIDEGRFIENSFRNLGITDVKTLSQPAAETLLQMLPKYNIVHFACHGCSSMNPADSHLLLQKDPVTVDKLRVRDIATIKLPLARLAYLSACSTAESTKLELIDEVTHIVSSFHVAGFSHVIGALWETEDEACTQMAREFYASFLATDNIVFAYRDAILKLRAQKPAQPMYWAPFIHFGG